LFAPIVPFLFVALLLAMHLAVKFVCLDVGRFDVANGRVVEVGALLANGCQNIQYRFLAQSGQPACGADANAFTQQPDNFDDLTRLDSQAVQRLRLAKGFAAAQTTETAHFTVSISEFGEVFGFAGATYTVQLAFLGKVNYREVVSDKICDWTQLTLRLVAPCWCF
jgi:DUF1009 family protein